MELFELVWTIVEISVCFIIIFVHIIGSFCLIYVIRAENGTVQHTLILNASITEILGRSTEE